MDDWQLLDEYAARNSDEAFRALADRYAGMVYHSALRQVRDPHTAEEVTQAVFIALARKAGRIPRKTVLSGWLVRATRFAVLNLVREETRRRRHEQEALAMENTVAANDADSVWEKVSPHLDDALNRLSPGDRDAVAIRFFENKSHKEVAESLGLSEEAARRRVSRAVERLRGIFASRGIVVPAAVLVAAFAAHGAQAAPIGLASTVAAAVVTKGTVGASTLTTARGILKLMAWAKLKTAVVIGAGCLIAVATTAFIVHETGETKAAAAKSSVGEVGFLKTFSAESEPTLFLRYTEEQSPLNIPGETTSDRTQTFHGLLIKTPFGFVAARSGIPLEFGNQPGARLRANGMVSNVVWSFMNNLDFFVTNEPDATWKDPGTHLNEVAFLRGILNFGVSKASPFSWTGNSFSAEVRTMNAVNNTRGTMTINGELTVSNGLPMLLVIRHGGNAGQMVHYTYNRHFEVPFPSEIRSELYAGANTLMGTTIYRIEEARRTVTREEEAAFDPHYYLRLGNNLAANATPEQREQISNAVASFLGEVPNTRGAMRGSNQIQEILHSNGVVVAATWGEGGSWIHVGPPDSNGPAGRGVPGSPLKK